jgi:pimeloyl-CoA dehydrogenase small subunit
VDFALSEEQRLMQDSLSRLLQRSYGFEQRREYQRSATGWSGDLWRQYAEMGLLALPFDERHGGLSGTPVETMIVMEQLGRAITLEPYLATVVLAGGVLRHAGSDGQNGRIIGKIIEGTWTLALAHEEAAAHGDLAYVETTARLTGGTWRLDGEKSFALHGGSANAIIVSARVGGTSPTDRDGIGLFLVDPDDPGVRIDDYPLHDGQRAAAVRLSSATVAQGDVIGVPGKAFPVLERVYQEAIAAICAEAVGVMAELHEMTVAYLKQRRQFGVPIGNFQALQHRAADMYIALEQAKSMAIFATMMSAHSNDSARALAVSAAKVQIGRSGRWIGEQAMQLHGGIAMAMEFKAGHYFKKLTMLDQFLGDADHHLELLSAGDGLFEHD